tara:strand:+ start:1426 stop:2022 length:597 start_codon:yes stop_codon:yes gene_type:complete
MIKFLLILLVVLVSPFSVAGDDFKTSEHNFNFQGDKLGLKVRSLYGSSYNHLEFGYKPWKPVEVGFRYAESGSTTESNYKLRHTLGKWWGVDMAHQLEYRTFSGDTTDYYRWRIIVGYKKKFGDNWAVWGKVQPRWKYYTANDLVNDGAIDDIKSQIGVDYTRNKVTFTPFIQVMNHGDAGGYRMDNTTLGTNLTIKF